MSERTVETNIRLACLLEASARKAGNVHPAASFEHISYQDFVNSADAIAPVLARAGLAGVGPSILEAVRATRSRCGFNTNLGIILLLAPLAALPADCCASDRIESLLSSLQQDDTACVFEAIRIAQPRGLGVSPQQDVSDTQPTAPLVDVMRLAEQRDSIAAQYTTGFELVLRFGVPALVQAWTSSRQWEPAIQTLQLRLMAAQPDTDIARKRGLDDARESADRAAAVLARNWPDSPASQQAFGSFDAWLREFGSQRNPGTTADLVTACLFVALRERLIEPPDEALIHEHAAALSPNS